MEDNKKSGLFNFPSIVAFGGRGEWRARYPRPPAEGLLPSCITYFLEN